MANLITGFDLSAIRGANINFQAIVNSGASFIINRCGIGNSGIDTLYSKNIAAAKAVGLNVAAYHFVYPLPTITSQPLRDPVKQAQYHFNAAGGELAACDFEWPTSTDWAKWGCSAQQINDWGLTYLEEYSRLDGRQMILYTYPYFVQSVNFSLDYGQYPLWIASYEATPAIPAPWANVGYSWWQNSGGTQHLPGTSIPVDTDFAKDLSLWNVQPAAPVVVAPVAPPPDPVPVPVVVPPPVAPAPQPLPAVSIWMTILNAFINLFKK